jgi:hypothetical protein
MTANSTGNCYLCGATLGKAAMKNHLFKLHGEDKGGQECYLLKIEGSYPKGYWLYIDVPKEKTLSAVDGFLRKIWLECCGHMSAFLYPGYTEIGMSRKLGSFAVGDNFLHHYDFGTTTETVITIMGNSIRKPQKGIVRLLARNAPPVFQCNDCGKPAEYIGTMLEDTSENLYYCADCCEKYDEDEEIALLPVTNSPRMGQCGYDGEYDSFEFDPISISAKKKEVS